MAKLAERACEISIRSNGSAWCSGNCSTPAACASVISSGVIRLIANCSGSQSSISSGTCSLPRRFLIAISQAEATLTNTTLRGSFTSSTVCSCKRSLSSRYQMSTCVSSRRFNISLVEHLQDLRRQGFIRVVRNTYAAAHAARPPRCHVSLIRHEPSDRLSAPGNDDLFATRGAIDQAGQVGLGLMEIELHQQRLARDLD